MLCSKKDLGFSSQITATSWKPQFLQSFNYSKDLTDACLIFEAGCFQTYCLDTLAKTEIIYPKNVEAQVAMDFTEDKNPTPRTIEKMKIMGAVLELPA